MSENTIFILLGYFIVGLLLFEVVLLGVSFAFADEVECNLLWCTFKTTRREVTCFQNAVPINCSELPDFNLIVGDKNSIP